MWFNYLLESVWLIEEELLLEYACEDSSSTHTYWFNMRREGKQKVYASSEIENSFSDSCKV